MRHFPRCSTAHLLRSRKARGLGLLPVAAGLLLFGRPPLAPAQDLPRAPEPQFSTQPMPAGDVSFQNLHFRPLDFSGFPALASKLKVAYRDGAVTITEDRPNADAVWSGPAADASFIEETMGGVHTLEDSTGKVLWSDAADIAKPDLLFVKTRDGKARLSGAGGVTLWAGLLPPSPEVGGSIQSRGDQVSIVMPGLRIDGAGGVFRVTSGKLLWVGRLRPSPLLVIRDGHAFSIYGPNGSGGGWDAPRRVSMEAEAETVTVADTEGRTLGTRAVDSLAVRYEIGGASARGLKSPAEHKAQEGELDAVGTLLLTYRDGAGRVLRRVTVYKDAHGGSGRLG